MSCPPRAGARDLLVPEVVPHLGLPVRALGDSMLLGLDPVSNFQALSESEFVLL